MPSIRIIRVPAGEAPETIRQAWVGIVIPLTNDKFGKRGKRPGFGVLSGPKSWVMNLIDFIRGRYIPYDGYTVDAKIAFERLAESNPVAARWWHENTPHLLRPNWKLVFEADACEEIP